MFFTSIFLLYLTFTLSAKKQTFYDIEKLYLLSKYSLCIKAKTHSIKQDYIKAICYKALNKDSKYLKILSKISVKKDTNKILKNLATLDSFLVQAKLKHKNIKKGLNLLKKINKNLYITWIINKWI